MKRRLVLVAVLYAAIYWADCGFEVSVPPPDEPPPPVLWNRFFGGCFQGLVGPDEVTAVFTAPETNDVETFTGCLSIKGTRIQGTLVGDVDDAVRERAAVVVAVPTTTGSFDLTATRDPAGETDAVTVRLTDAGGAPPQLADTGSLARCPVALTCTDLGITMPFAPEVP